MSTVYGTDIAALTDLPDPEILCSEEICALYACAHRLMTPDDELSKIGETEHYDSININDWLGDSFDLTSSKTLSDLELQATQVLLAEPYAQGGVTVNATYVAGTLTVTVNIVGAPGPFSLVFTSGAAGVTSSILLPG